MMDRTSVLNAARSGISEMAPRTIELIRTLPDTAIPLHNSEWSVREAAAHLAVVMGIFTEQAAGAPSPVVYPAGYAEAMAARNEEIPESDPIKLAEIVAEAVDRWFDTTAERSGDQAVDRFGHHRERLRRSRTATTPNSQLRSWTRPERPSLA